MASDQAFKAIYFPDYKIENPNARGLVLAFGKNDEDVHGAIAPLSSHEVRELLHVHSYKDLEKKAQQENISLNSYCITELKKAVTNGASTKGGTKIDPVHVTFKGGRDNPLHKWYSYLEGYSPEFVEHILDNYAPKASTVYDPFAGTGVTALVAAQRGLRALYSEVNPLLQALVKTKIDVSLLPEKKRAAVLKNLYSMQGGLSELINKAQPDASLLQNYKNAFNGSEFFDDKTFDLVLRARTLIDEISYTHQLTADLLQVAIVNALIPASLLQRAGDVRYKTKKELTKKVEFIEKVEQNLSNIIEDIENLESLPSRPILLTEGAQGLSKLPSSKIDAVITSPPYLNGTNYFRNTKVELWFLRGIKTKGDLAEFRYEAVTAGINDVTKRKPLTFVSKNVEDVVKKLEKNAYDPRIPKMVADYFSDMRAIFDDLLSHLAPKALVAVDIGDSVYAGVKVPTDELLAEVLKNLGYKEKDRVTLRKRMSRSGEVLKQVLLIFEGPEKSSNEDSAQKPDWKDAWGTFKNTLPHTTHPFSKRNWGHPLHSLCSYQGKLKPSLAYYLVKTFTKPGQKVLDPFAGVGTIPFEAALNGRASYSFDISPAAIHIARAKIGKVDKTRIQKTIQDLDQFINKEKVDRNALQEAKQFGFNKKLVEYYDPKTLEEIVKARQFFKELPEFTSSESLVVSSLLHILHGNRPYALSRRSHGITPFAPTGEYEYRALIPRLKEKVERSLRTEVPESFLPGEVLYQDATSWWPKHVKDLDAIITSPPFFDSTRFYLANWLRLWFSGWDNQDFSNKPLGFIDEKQKVGFDVYEPILRQARERLKPDGILVFHLGKSSKCDMAEKLADIAKPWFTTADVFEESVEGRESFGVRDQGTVVKHQFLLLS
ncbi:MAG: DNA methyltransferase [Candidatus Paceibacterota bacterium]